MPNDPYAVLRALLRAEALRNAPKPDHRPEPDGQPSDRHLSDGQLPGGPPPITPTKENGRD